jgi:phospholipase D1/2
LLGERDSELAVLVMDDDIERANINGDGPAPVRAFAHHLRVKIWEKLFGISGEVRPAKDLQIAISQPGSPESWRLIQKRAAHNAEIFEAAFDFIPRSFFVDKELGKKSCANYSELD